VVDGDKRWTYAELNARVSGFDSALDELGRRRGDVVAVLGRPRAGRRLPRRSNT